MIWDWRRAVLLVAAAWNVSGGASALLVPERHLELYTASLSLADPLILFFYRCAWINVMAWGGAYVLAAFMPEARVPVLVAGGLGKAAYFVAFWAMYATGVGTSGLLFAGCMDLLLALMFAVILTVDRRERSIG